jgi:hypothetical protein
MSHTVRDHLFLSRLKDLFRFIHGVSFVGDNQTILRTGKRVKGIKKKQITSSFLSRTVIFPGLRAMVCPYHEIVYFFISQYNPLSFLFKRRVVIAILVNNRSS